MDICVERAKAKEEVARAELEFSYTGMPKDDNKVTVAKGGSTDAVARERCDDQSGNAKSVFTLESRAGEDKALAGATLGRGVREATTDAAADKRAADYKVAAEKCDAMSGDA